MLILHFQQTQEQSHSASAKRSMEAAPDPVSLVMCKDSAKTLWSRTLGQVNEDKGYIIIYIHMGYIMICRDNQKKYLRNICSY